MMNEEIEPTDCVLTSVLNFEETEPNSASIMKKLAIVNIETTGLSADYDKITELTALKVDYDMVTGVCHKVTDIYESYNNPGIPIPVRVSKITGITDGMVSSIIKEEDISSFFQDVSVIISWPASFSRPFCEKAFPSIFTQKPWISIKDDYDWPIELGHTPNLISLLSSFGYFMPSRSGLNSCYGILSVMNSTLSSGNLVFNEITTLTRQPSYKIIAVTEARIDPSWKSRLYTLGFRYRENVLNKETGKKTSGYVLDCSGVNAEEIYKDVSQASGLKVSVGISTAFEKYKLTPTIRNYI